MAKNNNLNDFLTDVANSIRTKTGTTEQINAQDFSDKILSIQSESTLKKLLDTTIHILAKILNLILILILIHTQIKYQIINQYLISIVNTFGKD